MADRARRLPERWKSVHWTRDDEFEYPEGGVAAVLTTLIEEFMARKAENGADIDAPWFAPYRKDVHVYLQLTEAEGAPPYEERLRALRESLAPGLPRRDRPTGARHGPLARTA